MDYFLLFYSINILFTFPWLFPSPMSPAKQSRVCMLSHWSRLPRAPPSDLPDLGIEPATHVSCIGKQVLYHQHHPGKSQNSLILPLIHHHFDYYLNSGNSNCTYIVSGFLKIKQPPLSLTTICLFQSPIGVKKKTKIFFMVLNFLYYHKTSDDYVVSPQNASLAKGKIQRGY